MSIVKYINDLAEQYKEEGAITIDGMTYTEFPDGFWRKLAKEVNYLNDSVKLVPITNWEEFAKQPPYAPYIPLQWNDGKDWGNIIKNVHEQIMDEGLKRIGEYNSQFFHKDDEGDK